MTKPLLELQNLTVSYRQGNAWLDALRDLNLTLHRGQTYGLVGESGSGKSTLALAVMRYLNDDGRITRGSMTFAGQDLLAMQGRALQELWRERIKLVPQNPLPSLNPSLRIEPQLLEGLRAADRRKARQRMLGMLERVGLADPERVARAYPHELSGGMQQRVMIAMAFLGEPELLVLDEPTTNLDVTTEAVILDLMKDLIAERNTAVLYVSHSLGVVARVCDRVAVLYAGELVEDAPVAELYAKPLHPYTQGLLDSVPRLGQDKFEGALRPIPGRIPDLQARPHGCIYSSRCPLVLDVCREVPPSLEAPHAGRHSRCHRWQEIDREEVDPRQPVTDEQTLLSQEETETVLAVQDLTKHFALQPSLLERLTGKTSRVLRAVDGIDLDIRRGRTLGLVGESGSGKSTLARCIIGLTPPTGGTMELLELPLAPTVSARDADTLRKVQMVFQSSDEALNPYLSVRAILRRPLVRLAGYPGRQADEAVVKLLKAVQLNPAYAGRLPGQLSGGERQRVAIARAFAANPDLLLLDESVSGLDVSVQAAILNLLGTLQLEHRNAYLFISHDLAVVGYLADDIAVIYLGHLMEVGPTRRVLEPPYHPYTEALLSAVPVLDPNAPDMGVRLEGEVPSPLNIPSGCRFHTRCPRFLGDICVQQEPPWREGEDGHRIYCHIPLDELTAVQAHLLASDAQPLDMHPLDVQPQET